MPDPRLIPETEALAVLAAARTETLSSQREAPRLRRPDRAQTVLEPVCLDEQLPAARNNPKNNKKDRVKPVRVSRTDPESSKMKMADGGIRPAYNLQLATYPTNGAIVGVDGVNSPADFPAKRPVTRAS